jgi:predicted dienelactone hydrolase
MRIPCCVVLFVGALAGQEYYSVPGVDAPELAKRGKYAVGVRTLEIVNPGQVDILHFDKATGKAPLYDRPLPLEVWYPATIPPGKEQRTTYESAMPGNPDRLAPGLPKTFRIAGKALREAPPVRGEQFPLVVVSHGYPGSRTFLSYLTENLASKGYVVAAIDHTDSVDGAVRGFQSTLLNRASDQLFTMQALEQESRKADDFLHGLLDSSRAAIVGYSMGGYGALAAAGAGYSKKSPAMTFVPGGYFEEWTAGNPKFAARRIENLKALVAIAPWGAQPPYLLWDDESLAAIRIPSLFIAGDRDDVSEYEEGTKRVFEHASRSERCLLVYENANHNVGGNPPPPEVMGDFATREHFDEPVWRKDRITAINQHFITAFLDLYLKGDEGRRAYLHPVIAKSNGGKWLLKQGESVGAAYSDGKTYWKGFQRRWATGLEMWCKAGE